MARMIHTMTIAGGVSLMKASASRLLGAMAAAFEAAAIVVIRC